jgi:DNA-binding NarL/FixJ family response regulator
MLLHIDEDQAFTRAMAQRMAKAGIDSQSLNAASLWRETILKADAGIVLLDLELGTLDGLDLIPEIRRLDGDRRVVVLTRSMHLPVLERALQAGADYFFFKSEFDFNELVGAVHAIQFQRVHWCRAGRVVADLSRARGGAEVSSEGVASKPIPPVRVPPPMSESKISFLSEAFPRFLVDTGRVSLDTLMKAVEYADRQRPLLGQIALEAGRLSMRQIFQIVEDQVVSREPFGKIAVRLGMLQVDDVEQLLELQRERRPDIGAALVSLGSISQTQLVTFQNDYRQYMAHKEYDSTPEPDTAGTLSTSA